MAQKLTVVQEKANQVPCPMCNGTHYEWGWLHHAWYNPKSWLPWKHKLVTVRRCLNCNNLLEFVDEQRSRRSYLIRLVLSITMLAFVAAMLFILLNGFAAIALTLQRG